MTLLVAVDITLYNVGSKENVRKEFVVEVSGKDFTGENDFYVHIRGIVRERIGDMYHTEHFGFAILNIVNLTDFIK